MCSVCPCVHEKHKTPLMFVQEIVSKQCEECLQLLYSLQFTTRGNWQWQCQLRHIWPQIQQIERRAKSFLGNCFFWRSHLFYSWLSRQALREDLLDLHNAPVHLYNSLLMQWLSLGFLVDIIVGFWWRGAFPAFFSRNPKCDVEQ